MDSEDLFEAYLHGFVDRKLLGSPADALRKPVAKIFGRTVEIFDLTQPFSGMSPIWPYVAGNPSVVRLRAHNHDRVVAHSITHTMHVGTHVDAPLHVEEGYPSIDQMPLERYIGDGVIVSIPKKEWEIITPQDLEKAKPTIEEGDIVIINSGWHHYYGDNSRYFCYAPGLYKEAAEWFVKKKVKGVGVDQPAMDHPLGTRLVQTGGGYQPLLPWLIDLYKKLKGRDVYQDFPYWEPCHRILYTNGIFGIENVGGDLDKITGKRCTIAAIPLKWQGGDGSMVRVIAITEKK
jgi:kynurenine formamidase